ncbi:uncharacterized protein UV8b_08250 [Ustilaginoidea virens]|uniref:Uncharacterized protein n=1 Tax=Ustilaginoidea virens TaxID=1159556 RepID=A0A063CAK6_USTVR|nr:uncharacterized protein UV8b_08250 [Ustilaginoidea virens]QUC24009.1 hypothetical protein UV8b_08250 [Ustilaginoidea virens]GAO16238.1 hypothetical protein UVI_02000200 [Ustilaginoidea virens]
MHTSRRSTAGSRGRTGPTKGQSTISFANKVTKSVPKATKKLQSPAHTQPELPERTAPGAKRPQETVDDGHEEDEAGAPQPEAPAAKSAAEAAAEKVTDSQIRKYWKGIERIRKAPRVHQAELSVDEKVLRYFDVSSQYGPCIGIDRTKRWQRAERLGLSPPIEVLSVLLKEKKNPARGAETAQMDDILNPIASGP